MTLERQAIAGLKWGALAKLLTQAVGWGATLVVIRLLVPGDYGLMALSAVVISIFGGVAELGLGASLIQARNLTRGDLERVAGALLLLNCVCGGIVFLAAPLAAQIFDLPRLSLVVRISAVQFLLGAVVAVPQALVYRDMRFRWLAATDIASGLVTSAATLSLALAGAGVWALVLGNLIGYGVRTAFFLFGGRFVRPTFAFRGIGQFIRFGSALSAARFAWQLTYQADVLIAARFLSQEAVGLYSVAVHLANLPLQKTMGIVNQVAFPAIASLQDELPRMRRRLLSAFRLLGVGAVPALWGISAVAPEFVHVVLGPQWKPAVMALQVIALVAPLRIVATVFATALSAVGRADVELTNTLVSLAVFAAAVLVGVQWGVDGVAVAYVVAIIISVSLTFPRTARIVGVSLSEIGTACRGSLISGLAMLAVVAAARFAMQEVEELLRLPVLIVVGAASYVGTLSLLDRQIWREARKVVVALRES